MRRVVIYKSTYGSTAQYAGWIANELGCEAYDVKSVNADMLNDYDTIIYGGGLYAEVIAGFSFLTKNIEAIKSKKLIVFTTGIAPTDCREYYDVMVVNKNIKPEHRHLFKIFNYPGKMILSELTLVHRTAIKTLKKIMSAKTNPTKMEKLLIELCDADGDFSDKSLINDLVAYAKD